MRKLLRKPTLLVAALACSAAAQSTCPWMNAATASGFLGGESSGKFTSNGSSNETGICEFVRTNASGTLRIEIEIMKSPTTDFAKYLQKCSPNAKPLKAIGNEAVVCTVDRDQRVIGHVRDQAFVIEVIGRNATPDTVKRAAEIVAGNLF